MTVPATALVEDVAGAADSEDEAAAVDDGDCDGFDPQAVKARTTAATGTVSRILLFI
jgi:hypothetical protein